MEIKQEMVTTLYEGSRLVGLVIRDPKSGKNVICSCEEEKEQGIFELLKRLAGQPTVKKEE